VTIIVLEVGHHGGSLFSKLRLEGSKSFRSNNPSGKS
jgi:hypothetical protein